MSTLDDRQTRPNNASLLVLAFSFPHKIKPHPLSQNCFLFPATNTTKLLSPASPPIRRSAAGPLSSYSANNRYRISPGGFSSSFSHSTPDSITGFASDSLVGKAIDPSPTSSLPLLCSFFSISEESQAKGYPPKASTIAALIEKATTPLLLPFSSFLHHLLLP